MKKLTAWILVLAMAVTFIPTFAFADEEGDVVDDVRAAAQVGVD